MPNEEFASPEESREFAHDYDRNLTLGSNDFVRNEIYQALGNESGVDVHVKNGVVILTGMVDHEEMRAAAEDLIKNIPGVYEVINELTVKKLN